MADLKVASQEYWTQGANIVVLKGKQPLHEWQKWQTQRQSEAEFEGLPWSQADGFGVICGTELDNGLYLVALDYDVKNVSEEAKQKGKAVIERLPVTQLESTPSSGLHLTYFSHKKPKTISAYHNECGLELLGSGKLCIMAPSQNYKRLNDNLPSTVQDIESLFHQALEKVGIETQSRAVVWFDRKDLLGKSYKGKDPPCITTLLKGTIQGSRNEYCIRLGSYLVNFKRVELDKAWKKIQHWNTRNTPSLPEAELQAAFQSAVKNGYVYGCNDNILSSLCEKEGCPLNQQAGSPDKSSGKKTKRKQRKDSGYTESGCFEAICTDEKPAFLVKDCEIFSVVECMETDGETFYPKDARQVPYEPYGYFEGAVPNDEDLFWKVMNEFQTFIDVESIWKQVLSACTLLSYRQEKLHTVPYVFLYGDNESGKSTVLQLLKSLCYRPMYGVTVPAADIYGYLEDSDSIGCILEDEVQGIHKDTDKIKIYKAGYKRGAVVPRTIITSFDRLIKYYQVFCFKACVSEQIPQVKGFRERFIEIPMVEGFPQKEWTDVTKEDLKRLSDLRNMLLKWRMLSRTWELPDVQLPMKGRLKELWKPILQVTHGLTVFDSLLGFAEAQKKERLSAKQNTLEGHIVKVVVDLCNQANSDPNLRVPFPTIWSELVLDLDGKIDDKKPHTMETSEFFRVTKNKVGYRLREVMSGKSDVLRQKDKDGEWISTKVYVFDSEKLKRVAKKYGCEAVTKLPTLPSSKGVEAPESMEKTSGKDGEPASYTPLELGNLGNSVTAAESTLETLTLDTCKLERLTFNCKGKCFSCDFSGRLDWRITRHDGSWNVLCDRCGSELQKRLGEQQ
jgi:hypothetical protein